MTGIQRNNKRIVINTTVSYARTIISLIATLFSSRWVLQELGVSDFGVYNVVGSVLAIIIFLNTILSAGDARFFAIAIGKGGKEELSKVFNTSISIHFCMPIIVLLIGLALGEWLIINVLTIPLDRQIAALWVFRITMCVSFFDMVTVPYVALFIAYQNIAENTIISLIRTVLVFLSAFSLMYLDGDKLIFYAFFMGFAQLLSRLVEVIVSYRMYDCARLKSKYFFNRTYLKPMLKYSFWNLLGDLGHLVRTQGISIVTNLYFGPAGNAALGIANQVSMQACHLTNAISGATAPEIYTRVGEGNHKSAIHMASNVSKIATFFMILFSVPIIFNIDGLLEIWLVKPPKDASVLCVAFIIMFVFEKFTTGYYSYLAAIGKIALSQILVFLSYSFAVIFPFMGLLNMGIVGIGISCILSMILSRLFIFICIIKYTSISAKEILINNVTRFIVMSVILFILYLFSYNLLKDLSHGFVNVLLSCLLLFIFVFILGFFLFFARDERMLVLKKIKK